MKTNTSAFNIDFVDVNPAWAELFELFDAHNDERNLAVIEELLALRKITSETNNELAEEAIRQLGINISRDMMSYRLDPLKRVIDCLPDWNQVNGTTDWNKFVGMLLGGQFDTTRLYTGDYQTFVPTPLGVLVKDGGTWYKTMHVSVEVDAHLINSGLDLTITVDAETDVVNALILIGMTEEDATTWFNNHIGFDPVNNDVAQYAARSAMFQLRIAQLFYQWAPVEEVLEAVYATINVTSKLVMTAHTVVEPVRRFMVGAPLASSISFIQPEFIRGGEFIQFGALINYSDSTEQTVIVDVVDNDWIEERDGQAVRFKEPLAITTITLTVKYNTTEQDMTLRLYPIGVEPDPKELTIEATTLYGSATSKIRVYGQYESGLTKELTDSGLVRLETTLGTLNGSSLVLPDVDADTELTITALYQGQFNMEQKATFPVLKSIRDLVPTSLSIQLDDEIAQGEDVQIKFVVQYNDTSSRMVVAQAKTTSEHTEIVENVLKSSVLRSDYLTTVYAEFGEGVPVTAIKQVKLKAPDIKLAAIDIILPAVIMEYEVIRPKAMALYVLGEATPQQIADRDPSIVVAYVEVSGIWFSSQDDVNDIKALATVDTKSGEFTAPAIDGDALKYALHFSFIEKGQTQTFNKIFLIYDTIMTPRTVSLRVSPSISNGATLMLPTVCLWNNGLSYAAAAALTAEYVPSASAVEEARVRTIKLQQEAVEQGEDPTQFNPDAPDYARWMTLTLIQSAVDVYDPVLKRMFKEYMLYYQGDLHGSARIAMTYEYEGTTVSDVREIQLVPQRSLVDSIVIECPDALYDRTRTFCRLLATYADGSQEYVTAAEWSGLWPDQDTDPYEVLKFLPGRYSGLSVVEIVEGRTPTDYKDFRAMEVSKLPMFNSIGDLAQLSTTYYDGAILNVGKCNYVTYTQVKARFFRIDNVMDLTITPQPKESINNVVGSRIEGSTQISAGASAASYALVLTYETNGIARTMDGSYLEEDKKKFELEVTSEWAVVQDYYLEAGPNDTQVLMPTTDAVADIDEDGMLTPNVNANCAVNIRARYACDGYSIEKTLLVYITQANTYLRSAGIIGPDIVWDVSDKNPTFGYDNGRWYVPYELRVIVEPEDEIVTTDGIWSIGDNTNVDGVSIDPLNGHLFISEQQLSDGTIGLSAVFTKQNPTSLITESITASRTIELYTNSMILSGSITVPDSNIEPLNTYQLIAEYVRRSGFGGSSVLPDTNTVKFAWSVIKSSSGFSLAQDGTFSFAASKDPQTVQVECTITEQRATIVLTQFVTCPGVGFPQDLTVGGFTNVRDDSSMELTAMLGRTGTFVREDVSAKSLWQLTNSNGDVVDVPGITVNASTGRITISQLLNDTEFGVKATYIEGQQRLQQTHFMTARSSYPRFGIAPFGLTNISSAMAQLTTRLRSTSGGQFVLSTKTDEYGYFVVRESYGQAIFAAAADNLGTINNGWIGFDGAKWPVTGDNGSVGPIVGRIVYDNLTENVLIYRTNARAFGSAVITVRYQ